VKRLRANLGELASRNGMPSRLARSRGITRTASPHTVVPKGKTRDRVCGMALTRLQELATVPMIDVRAYAEGSPINECCPGSIRQCASLVQAMRDW